MKRKLKYFILAVAFLCLGLEVYAQVDKGPPTPKTSAQAQPGNGNGGPPCDPGPPDGEKPGHGSPPPPPPGLCLPINDYLVPLFFAGLFLGAFQLWRVEKKTSPEADHQFLLRDNNR